MADRDPTPPRLQPRGAVKKLTDEDLDRLSEITPEDVEDAHITWRQVRDGMEDLLEAEPEREPDADPT